MAPIIEIIDYLYRPFTFLTGTMTSLLQALLAIRDLALNPFDYFVVCCEFISYGFIHIMLFVCSRFALGARVFPEDTAYSSPQNVEFNFLHL